MLTSQDQHPSECAPLPAGITAGATKRDPEIELMILRG